MFIGKKPRVLNRIKYAKSVILNGRQLFLKECAKCGDDFYGVAKQTRCNECVANRMKRAS
jgi:hypothetical protein